MVQVFRLKPFVQKPQWQKKWPSCRMTWSIQEAAAFAQGNPYSYFHIDRSEIDLPGIDPYDPQVYQKRRKIASFQEEGWLIQETAPAYYLYELTMAGRSQTGLVACTSIDDYVAGKIKKHEFTRPEKKSIGSIIFWHVMPIQVRFS